MQALNTSDYRGAVWPGKEDEDESYPLYVLLLSSPITIAAAFSYSSLFGFLNLNHLADTYSSRSPLVMKVRSRASSVISGASTPGGGTYKSLSERDLAKADAALSHVNDHHVNGVVDSAGTAKA